MRLAGLAILCVATTAMGAPTPATKTRAEFAKAIAAIKPGALASEVRAKLGPPDDIKTEHDPGGITAARSVEVWRYGTHGHLTFGTLGTVHVQADGVVQYVFGGRGAPPTSFAEADLRRLLELIDAVPSYNAQLDPLALIRAVDALQPLGKDRALAAIDEYLRVSSWLDDGGREGVFLLLRALFDVPAGGMPPMMVGAAETPSDPTAFNRFPLVIVNDIPLKLVGGYELGGEAERPEDDVAAFRKVATLRAKPLAPFGMVLDAIDELIAGPLGKAMKLDDNLKVSLYDQALRLTATVYRPADATFETWFPYGPNVAARWTAIRADVAKLAPAWDKKAQQLTSHGATIAPVPRPQFQRVWWDLALAGTTQARLTFERKTDALVDVELRFELTSGAKLAGDSIRFVDPATNKPIDTLPFASLAAPPNSTSGSVSGRQLKLARGQPVRPELASGARGPVLTP